MQTGKLRACRNILLRQLGGEDLTLLEPHLELVPFACGMAVIRPDDPLDALFFPDTALLALEGEAALGRQVEVGLVGLEGVLGWPLLLGCPLSSHTATVQMRAGTAWRIGWAPLRDACRTSATLAFRLLRFVETVMMQMGQSIASHLQDALDRRLARFLLMRHDRVNGDVLFLYHEAVAASLQVRRASVTDQLHILEGEKLIRCRRGHVTIRDRPALEAFAGEAYGAAEARYRTLIAPFGKSPLPLAA